MGQDSGIGSRALQASDVEKLDAIRAEMQNAMAFVASLGEGGWNHGAKIVYQHAELIENLAKSIGSLKKLASENREIAAE
jgi:hypothetical protein